MYGSMYLCILDNARNAHMLLRVLDLAAKRVYIKSNICLCVCVRAFDATQSVRMCVGYLIRFKASSLFEPPSETVDHSETVHVRNAAPTASTYM